MRKYILLTEKSWHNGLFKHLSERENEEWFRISSQSDFNLQKLKKIAPEKIFIPHWSHIIPSEIYDNYECIVFHMTDLPYGRGGSPLQNLIVRGHRETKISAIKVIKGIDTGKVYLKESLSLSGTAEEIYIRSAGIIEEMIKTIIKENPVPLAQEGEPVVFKRRKPEEGDLSVLAEPEQIYDYIRMLDCPGYPPAFLETDKLRIEFSNARMNKNDESITANVRIIKK